MDDADGGDGANDRTQVSGEVPTDDLAAARDVSGSTSNIGAVRYALRTVRRHDERGTDPESIFQGMYGLVEQNGGSVPVSIVNDQLAVLTQTGDGLLLGLDNEKYMHVQQLPQSELYDRVEQEIRSLNDDELVEKVRNAERERVELILAGLLSE